jgi:thiol-disulfide isomerase/thioredoxin
LLVIALGIAAFVSCGDTDSLSPRLRPQVPAVAPVAEQTAQSTANGAKPGDSTQVTLESIDENGWAQTLESYRGKVVFLDCWATWCTECVKLFPHTVQLHKDHADEGLVVVSLSFDDPTDADRAKEFLVGQGATFANFIAAYDPMKAVEAFEIPDGALPHFRLYDREGRLVNAFSQGPDGPLEVEAIERAVKEQLAR